MNLTCPEIGIAFFNVDHCYTQSETSLISARKGTGLA